MNNLKLWPHLTIVAVLCAIAAGVGVALWIKHERTASAEALPNAARIQRVEGDVALSDSLDSAANTQSEPQWVTATANQPFSVGDRIYTRDNSRASLAFSGRNFARLNPNTSLDVLSLDDRRTQLALRDGSAIFDVGYLAPGDLFEVATPYGAVDFNEPGLYNVGLENGNVIVSVLSGLAQVVGLGGSGQISKGEMLTLLGQTAADVILSRIDGRDAGYLVDNYYGYQYPQYYDGRYRDYNVYLNDPYYFDPYRRNVSYQYVNSYIPGLYDLDYYGNWQNLSGYGYAWSPRVGSGWAPYQDGYWMSDYPYGPTWVSSEPWGYAPYHYGRWAYVGNQWYWIPDSINNRPLYSPAMVAFVPFGQNEIGWVPLGPGDVYVPRYYDNRWQPYYLTRDEVSHVRVVNLNVPGAVTIVGVDDFTRGVAWKRARKADQNMLAQVNPVLDPLLLTPLRNAVVHSAWGRGKKDLPPGISKKLTETTVLTSTTPIAPPFRKDLAQSMRVQPVAERVKGQKFKVKDERQGKGIAQVPQAPTQVPIPDQTRRNVDTRRLQQEQRKQENNQQRIDRAMPDVQAERAARAAQQQAQGERVGRKATPEVQKQPAQQPARVRTEPGRVKNPRPEQPMSQPATQPRQQQPAKAVERHGPPVQAQPRGAQPKQEKQKSLPSQEAGGKGKGRKP